MRLVFAQIRPHEIGDSRLKDSGVVFFAEFQDAPNPVAKIVKMLFGRALLRHGI